TPEENIGLLITISFIIAAIISGVFRCSLLVCQTLLGNIIGNDLGVSIFTKVVNQPLMFHSNTNSGVIVSALMNKINTVVNYVLIPTMVLFTSTFISVGIVIILFLINWQITVSTLMGILFMYLTIGLYSSRKVKENGRRVAKGQTKVTKIIQETCGGIRDVLINYTQSKHISLYSIADKKLRTCHAKITILSGIPKPLVETLGLIFIGICGFNLTNQTVDTKTILPALGAFALAFQRLMPLVQQSYSSISSIISGQQAVDELLSLLERQGIDCVKTFVEDSKYKRILTTISKLLPEKCVTVLTMILDKKFGLHAGHSTRFILRKKEY
ncbi:ABC transporter transmembrane domain-containing protein, partial [Verrucomicrobia bacterium]|nr:ABC transporter transmembrane domain-containing protein [Verrucomicrobiota bacterium]